MNDYTTFHPVSSYVLLWHGGILP